MFDKPKIILKASGGSQENFRTEIGLYHNMNILSGDSGTGKTLLYSRIFNADSISAKYVDNSDVEVIFLDSLMYLKGVIAQIKTSESLYKLLIVDDVKGIFREEGFIDALKSNISSLYVLYIGRDFSNLVNARVTCFSEAIYVIDECDFNGLVTIKRVVDIVRSSNRLQESYRNTIDTCISEGKYSKGEAIYLKNFFKTVYCTDGRLGVIDGIRSVLDTNKDLKSLYIFVDMCSYGTEILNLIKYLSTVDNINFCICEQYSYEYTILEVMNRVFKIRQDTDYCLNHNGKDVESFESYVAEVLSGERFGLCGYFRKNSVPGIFNQKEDTCNSCTKIKRGAVCATYMKDKREWVSLIKERSEEGRIYVECAKGGNMLC